MSQNLKIYLKISENLKKYQNIASFKDKNWYFSKPFVRQKLNPYASTTNKDKRKQKPFQMVMHKVAKKQTGRSYADKKKALQESLKKQLKSYKH